MMFKTCGSVLSLVFLRRALPMQTRGLKLTCMMTTRTATIHAYAAVSVYISFSSPEDVW